MHKARYRKPVARCNRFDSRTSDFLEQILVVASMVIDDDSGGVMIEHLFSIPDVIPAVEASTHRVAVTFDLTTTSPEHVLMIHHGCLTNYATPCSYTSRQMNT